jgi:ribosomal subunit interface protein
VGAYFAGMPVPFRISFRDIEPSAAIEARARERADRLERFSDRITDCHVMVRSPHRHHHQGKLYEVHIRILVPGSEVVISHERPQDHAHEDLYVALRDAFDAAERHLEDHARRHDQRAKRHEAPQHGTVARLFPQDGYGFIETSDGLDVYFHEHAVVAGSFGDLDVGDEVRLEFSDQESETGPQATTVRPVGKHHIVEQ